MIRCLFHNIFFLIWFKIWIVFVENNGRNKLNCLINRGKTDVKSENKITENAFNCWMLPCHFRSNKNNVSFEAPLKGICLHSDYIAFLGFSFVDFTHVGGAIPFLPVVYSHSYNWDRIFTFLVGWRINIVFLSVNLLMDCIVLWSLLFIIKLSISIEHMWPAPTKPGTSRMGLFWDIGHWNFKCKNIVRRSYLRFWCFCNPWKLYLQPEIFWCWFIIV